MLLFEVLLPGAGHLYSSQWIFGPIKFVIFVIFIIISFTKIEQFFIPKCIIIAKNALIGGGDDKKDDDEEEKKQLKDEKDEKDVDNDEKKKDLIMSVRNINEDINKNQRSAKDQFDDCMALKPIDDKLHKFGGSYKDKCIYKILIYIFWTVYSIDIYLLFFKLYPDGKGIPYSD